MDAFFSRIFRFYIIVLGIGWQQGAAEWTFFCTQTFLRIETLTFGARPSLKWLPAQSVFQSGLVASQSWGARGHHCKGRERGKSFSCLSWRIYSLVGNETLMALGKPVLPPALARPRTATRNTLFCGKNRVRFWIDQKTTKVCTMFWMHFFAPLCAKVAPWTSSLVGLESADYQKNMLQSC